MTVAPDKRADVAKPADLVTLTIDGIEVSVPKGTLVIRAAEQLGIAIPRFCDHPLLDPVGACRQCIVEVEGQRKPVASCTMAVADGMVVKTQLSSEVARKAQEGTMELLLINHPLDCPVCDKGGECPLQNQAMANGRPESRFVDVKREYPKPVAISSQILLDRERCVLCARCTRFSQQVAGDPFIELFERSALEQVSTFEDEPFQSYFSGNTVQICPVGALTSADYRFRARPFDLVSTPSVAEHDAGGAAIRVDHRRGKVMRRLSDDDPQVNEEWISDKDRFAFKYATATERLTTPLVRDASTGELREVSWPEAFARAAEGLAEARARGVGVLTGGRLTVEDAYAYGKFARVALGTNDIDFRARPTGLPGAGGAIAEEDAFLAAVVAGTRPGNGGVTYTDLDTAPAVLLAGLEPEEECPTLFLRLRKAAKKNGLKVYGIAPFATRGLDKLGGTLLPAGPGGEAAVLETLTAPDRETAQPFAGAAEALRAGGAVVLVGERLAAVPGALSAVSLLALGTGARLAWVPRRAGDRGAVDAGCLPALLPGGRQVADAAARGELARYWDVDTLPAEPGRDTSAILAAAADGELGGLVVAGVDPADLPDPAAAEAALERVGFLVSLEIAASPVTRLADVVFPVAPAVEKAGSYLTWEGRLRSFDAVLPTGAMTDGRILDAVADELDVYLNTGDVARIRTELAGLPVTVAERPVPPAYRAVEAPTPGAGEAVLATWRHLIDLSSLATGDDYLAGTARTPLVRLSAATAAEIGATEGEPVTVATDRGAVTLPLAVTDMPDRVVWLPTNSPGSTVRRTLAADSGAVVRIAPGKPGEPGLGEGRPGEGDRDEPQRGDVPAGAAHAGTPPDSGPQPDVVPPDQPEAPRGRPGGTQGGAR